MPRVEGAGRARWTIPPPDNARAFHLPRVGASRVLVVDGDPGLTPSASEVYFLERALAPWGAAGAVRGGVLPDVTSSAGVPELDPEVHRVVFVANLADPGPLAARLTDFVRRGGGLVLALGDNVTSDLYNGPLAPLLPSPLKRAQALAAGGAEGVQTALPDTSLELFRPFARADGAPLPGPVAPLYTLQPFEDTDEVRTLLRTEGRAPARRAPRRPGSGAVVHRHPRPGLGFPSSPPTCLIQRMVTYLGGGRRRRRARRWRGGRPGRGRAAGGVLGPR